MCMVSVCIYLCICCKVTRFGAHLRLRSLYIQIILFVFQNIYFSVLFYVLSQI